MNSERHVAGRRPTRVRDADTVTLNGRRHRNVEGSIPRAGTFAQWGTLVIFSVVALSSATVLLEDRIEEDLSAVLTKLFWLGDERNIATATAFSFIAIAWLLATVTGYQQRSVGASWRRHWFGLSATFLYLAYDEAAQLHEQLSDPIKSMFDTGGLLNFAWVIPGMAVVAILGAIYLRFVRALPPQIRLMVILSAAVYLSGAIGMEMVGGYIIDNPGLWDAYRKVLTMEETLELLGMMLFSTAILKLLARDNEASRRYFAD